MTSSGAQSLRFSGDIDESFDFSAFVVNPGQDLVLNLKEVRSLNSVGLRSWLLWMKDLRNKVPRIYFQNCPQSVVTQMNILEGFLPMEAIVESFEVPFYCDECGTEEAFLARRGTDFVEGTTDHHESMDFKLERSCPKCKAVMTLDASADKYFNFLKQHK